jgi:hypothetical protein
MSDVDQTQLREYLTKVSVQALDRASQILTASSSTPDALQAAAVLIEAVSGASVAIGPIDPPDAT